MRFQLRRVSFLVLIGLLAGVASCMPSSVGTTDKETDPQAAEEDVVDDQTGPAAPSLFADPVVYRAGVGIQNFALADLNGDGHVDIAAVCRGDIEVQPNGVIEFAENGGVDILLNKGDGTFPSSTRFGTGHPSTICAADMDGDGSLDIITDTSRATDLGILLNNGNGSFSSAIASPVIGSPLAGDMDGDGDIDLVCFDDTVSVLLNNGDATLTSSVPFEFPHGGRPPDGTILVDIDNDGDLDVVATGSFELGDIAILRNDGVGILDTPELLVSGPRTYGIQLGDMNGDGVPDLVTAINGDSSTDFVDGGIAVLFADGNGSFGAPTFIATEPRLSVLVGDLDGDGDLDIIDDAQMVYLNTGLGGFEPGERLPGRINLPAHGGFGGDSKAADLDGDGDLDVIVVFAQFDIGDAPEDAFIAVWMNQTVP